jgi:hypothetical protein
MQVVRMCIQHSKRLGSVVDVEMLLSDNARYARPFTFSVLKSMLALFIVRLFETIFLGFDSVIINVMFRLLAHRFQ